MKWILIQPEYKYNVAFPLSLAHVATLFLEQSHENVLYFDLNLQTFESVKKLIKTKQNFTRHIWFHV